MELKPESLQVALQKVETKDQKECSIMEERPARIPLTMICNQSNLTKIIKRFHELENL